MAAPFHRRILPWIFAIVFFAIAPVIVFYTSGYRWNAKKGRVERNGTVIIDSTPSGADISIDGRKIGEATPATLQDVAPGIHRFTVEKTGYESWEKTLDVRPERVTFANEIWLWKRAEPRPQSTERVTRLTGSDDERYLVEFVDATTTELVVHDSFNPSVRRIRLASRLSRLMSLEWSSNRYLLIVPADGAPLVLDARSGQNATTLPAATYRWEGSTLVGLVTDGRVVLELPSLRVTKEPSASPVRDRLNSAELRDNDGALAFFPAQTSPRGYVLPPGAWHFFDRTLGRTIFRADGEWLSVRLQNDSAEMRRVAGDALRPFLQGGVERYLLVRSGELWLWNPAMDPELLYRQSDPITAAAWHRKGNDVFFATAKSVYALNLDQRDGRHVSLLASFDEISDVVALKDKLLVAATRGGIRGVWSLEIE